MFCPVRPGTKLSCGNIGKLHRLTSVYPSSAFAVFAGKSDVFLQGLLSGSAGVIGASVNILPKIHTQLFRLHAAGQLSEAMALQARLGHADWAASRLGGIGGIKAVVARDFGYGEPCVRGPLSEVGEDRLQGAHWDRLEELIQLEKTL